MRTCDNAVSAALMANFYTQGEICSNGTRVFVHAAIKEDVRRRAGGSTPSDASATRWTRPRDVGALISAEHRDKVLGYIEAGRRKGPRCCAAASARTTRRWRRLLRDAGGLR